MIILVEGCDKTGKSTLIRDITKYYDAPVFKSREKPTTKEQFQIGRTQGIYLGAYDVAKLRQKYLTVFDRGHVTELVYSQKRGYNAADYYKWGELEKEFKEHMMIIYMSAPVDVIADRFKEENEEYLSADEIEVTLERYEEYLRNTNLKVLRLSSITHPVDNIKMAIEFINLFHTYGHKRSI